MTPEYKEMVSNLAKPGEDIVASLCPATAHRIHMAIGISGEVGELLDCWEGVEVPDRENLVEELGDIEFYFEGLLQGYSLEQPSGMPHPEKPELGDPFLKCSILAADLLDTVKKEAIYRKDPNMDKITSLVNGFRFQLNRIYESMQVTKEEAHVHNMNKLLKGKNARYAAGSYSDKAAQDRADKGGAQ